MDYVKKIL